MMPNYNVMGVAVFQNSVSISSRFGGKNIRVNAISAGPMRTLAGSAIASARTVYKWQGEHSPYVIKYGRRGGSFIFLTYRPV